MRHPDERTDPDAELPTVALDDVVHQRTRLGVLVVLAEAGRAEFTYLKRRLHLSDGNLSRHLDVLIRAGFIEASKDSGSGRSRTWLRMTRNGKAALRAELRVMRSLLAIVDLD